jgi:hypothetical protein
MSTRKHRKFLSLYFFVLYYKTNIKHFSVLIYSYINTRGNWENEKLCENTPPFGHCVSTQFLIFPMYINTENVLYLLNIIQRLFDYMTPMFLENN